jgi:hypothetical protein
MKRVNGFFFATSVALPLTLGGCGSSNSNEDETGANDTGDDGGPGDDGTMDGGPGPGDDGSGDDDGVDDGGTMDDTGGPPTGCADPSDPAANRMEVSADIDGGASWTCDTIYVLTGPVFVRGGALTIEPGTTIQGAAGSALVIDQDATIEAVGTADGPIVFTSALPEGERNRGDWGGLVLLGAASVNLEGGVGAAEGFASAPSYGGSNDAHDCGTLQYVRVEWAGFELSAGNELNAITFYACGTDTTVDHVQAHMGSDDGIEMFGGTFDAKYLVVTGAADDSLDCDEGYRGRLQHVFLHQDPAIGDNCFEWSNQAVDFTAAPLTGPTVANVTCIGSGAGGDKSKGMTLKEGTEAFIYSSIFTDITNENVLLTHPETQATAEAGGIEIAGTIFGTSGTFNVGEGTTWAAADLEGFVTGEATNQVGVDPGLASIEWGSPDPTPGAAAADAGATPGDAFFDATTYAGAVDPAGENWTAEGWINYGT